MYQEACLEAAPIKQKKKKKPEPREEKKKKTKLLACGFHLLNPHPA